jgi:hypothetical protein
MYLIEFRSDTLQCLLAHDELIPRNNINPLPDILYIQLGRWNFCGDGEYIDYSRVAASSQVCFRIALRFRMCVDEDGAYTVRAGCTSTRRQCSIPPSSIQITSHFAGLQEYGLDQNMYTKFGSGTENNIPVALATCFPIYLTKQQSTFVPELLHSFVARGSLAWLCQ